VPFAETYMRFGVAVKPPVCGSLLRGKGRAVRSVQVVQRFVNKV